MFNINRKLFKMKPELGIWVGSFDFHYYILFIGHNLCEKLVPQIFVCLKMEKYLSTPRAMKLITEFQS